MPSSVMLWTCDALIVGGGPAGSTCAGSCAAAGWTCVLLDKADLSTPEALRRLDHARRAPDAPHRSGRLRTRPGAASDDRLSRRPDRRAARDGVVTTERSASAFAAASWTTICCAAPGPGCDGRSRCGRSSGPRRVWWSTGRCRRRCWWRRAGIFAPSPGCWAWPLAGAASPSWPPRNSRSNCALRAGPLRRSTRRSRKSTSATTCWATAGAFAKGPLLNVGLGREGARPSARARPRLLPVPPAARPHRRRACRPSFTGMPTNCTTIRRGRCWPTACCGSATRPAWPRRKAAKGLARRSSRACWRRASLWPPAAIIVGSGWSPIGVGSRGVSDGGGGVRPPSDRLPRCGGCWAEVLGQSVVCPPGGVGPLVLARGTSGVGARLTRRRRLPRPCS